MHVSIHVSLYRFSTKNIEKSLTCGDGLYVLPIRLCVIFTCRILSTGKPRKVHALIWDSPKEFSKNKSKFRHVTLEPVWKDSIFLKRHLFFVNDDVNKNLFFFLFARISNECVQFRLFFIELQSNDLQYMLFSQHLHKFRKGKEVRGFLNKC